jgi:hypothetical protein
MSQSKIRENHNKLFSYSHVSYDFKVFALQPCLCIVRLCARRSYVSKDSERPCWCEVGERCLCGTRYS